MGTLLALASALCYGVADFTGGLLSRRVHFAAVALVGQVGGLLLTLLVAPFWSAPSVTAAALGWGALSGLGTGMAMLFLFRGLSRGAMSVVVPVSAVGGVALPVLAGVAFLGDRPSVLAWIGIAVSVPALWLVSRTGDGGERATAAASLDGLLAGVGIAVQYLALAQSAPEAGGWPVVAGRAAATVALLPLIRTIPGLPGIRQTAGAAGTGALAATALICYLVATRQQLLVVAVVLSSFYPAVPVLLGITVLRERLSWYQTTGLTGAALAIGLLTFG